MYNSSKRFQKGVAYSISILVAQDSSSFIKDSFRILAFNFATMIDTI